MAQNDHSNQNFDIKWLGLDEIIPYARNPRKNEGAVAKTAESIQEFGWQQPIVVDKDRVIIAGHTRLLAAQQLGLATAPVHVACDLTPAQAKAYRLADNRVGEEADWDFPLLNLEFQALDIGAFTGFEIDEINVLKGETPGQADPDPVPDPPMLTTELGDVCEPGQPQVCGDVTDAVTVAKCLDGEEPHLMVTDDLDWPTRAKLWVGGKLLSAGVYVIGKVHKDDAAYWYAAQMIVKETPQLEV